MKKYIVILFFLVLVSNSYANNKINIQTYEPHPNTYNWLKKHISITFNDVPKASCNFTTDQTGECFITKPGEFHNLISEAAKEQFGRNANIEMGTDGGTSDARFIKDYCEVLELGIVNNTLHQINENVSITNLKDLHNLYFKILEKYFQKT